MSNQNQPVSKASSLRTDCGITDTCIRHLDNVKENPESEELFVKLIRCLQADANLDK